MALQSSGFKSPFRPFLLQFTVSSTEKKTVVAGFFSATHRHSFQLAVLILEIHQLTSYKILCFCSLDFNYLFFKLEFKGFTYYFYLGKV